MRVKTFKIKIKDVYLRMIKSLQKNFCQMYYNFDTDNVESCYNDNFQNMNEYGKIIKVEVKKEYIDLLVDITNYKESE